MISSAGSLPPRDSEAGSQSEKFSFRRPSLTSFATSHDTGATLEYHGQTVSLLWQSKQARWPSARVCGLSQFGSLTTAGVGFATPVWTNWIKANYTHPAAHPPH